MPRQKERKEDNMELKCVVCHGILLAGDEYLIIGAWYLSKEGSRQGPAVAIHERHIGIDIREALAAKAYTKLGIT